MGSVDAATENGFARLLRELEELRAENVRLSRLLDLRGQNTAPAPEQLVAAMAPPGLVTMSSPVEDKLAVYADRFGGGAPAAGGRIRVTGQEALPAGGVPCQFIGVLAYDRARFLSGGKTWRMAMKSAVGASEPAR